MPVPLCLEIPPLRAIVLRAQGWCLAILLILFTLSGPAWSLSEDECRRDTQDLLEEIKGNRQHSNEQYRQAMAEANTEQERDAQKEQMEQIWHEEEQLLGVADQMLRDCLRHVLLLQKKAVNQ